MVIRIAGRAAPAAAVIWILMTGPEASPARAQLVAPGTPRAAAQLPPPMFSPWYAEALRDVQQLEPADVARLEQQLAGHPDDLQTRLRLMAYYQRADRAGRREDLTKRFQHALWLIQHHPESEILHSYVSRFSRSQLTTTEYERGVTLWQAAAKARPGEAAVQWNGASFFQNLDAGLHLDYLEATAAADPNHPFALRPLAHLYALAILERGPLASRAQAGLEASKNVWVLGNAAYMLQSQYNQSLQMGAPNSRAAELAERYFLRAKVLDPKLDRNAILPQLDVREIAQARQAEQQSQRDRQVRAAEAVGNIRRLPVDAFPKLPATIAAVLRARNCSVPQPTVDGMPRNVISGEFFAKGQAGWAVLCSVKNSTTLLAFRNDRDTNPDVINVSEDAGYLQLLDHDQAVYSRQITAVGRDFIMGHYRAYGGPEPPPITHQGIDDAFLEKASSTWYFHRGGWLRLQGAD